MRVRACVCVSTRNRPRLGPSRPVEADDHSASQAVSPPHDPIIGKLKFTVQPYIDINILCKWTKREWRGVINREGFVSAFIMLLDIEYIATGPVSGY